MAPPARFLRTSSPAHYNVKIQNYSIIANESKLSKYESRNFNVGGYQWTLVVYPQGNKRGNGHLSLDLALADKSKVAKGAEILVDAKMFIFDHSKDKYLTVQDVENVWRYHDTKTKWGFDEFIPLKDLTANDDRYRKNDSIILGVEILIVKNSGIGECLTIRYPINKVPVTHQWRISNYSKLGDGTIYQDKIYNFGGYKWKLNFYPQGSISAKGKTISMYIRVADWPTDSQDKMIYMEFILRVKNHFPKNASHQKKMKHKFNTDSTSWGEESLVALEDVKDISKGWLVNDVLVLEVEVIAWSHINDFNI